MDECGIVILLIDTCGALGSVALVEGGGDEARVVARESLPEREASAALLPAVGRLMAGRALPALEAVGVVSGPGSFTGVRVGMAAAKGLCEGTGARLVAVSRLAVLADAAGFSIEGMDWPAMETQIPFGNDNKWESAGQRFVSGAGMAVLDAGRGEFYVRGVDGGERLLRREGIVFGEGVRVAVAEESIFEALARWGAERFALDAACALRCVMRAMELPVLDAALVDANYVRAESDIYAKGGGAKAGEGKSSGVVPA
jgi:tRNA threonylcarbamoyladenosine biosynthesis protein TsaB